MPPLTDEQLCKLTPHLSYHPISVTQETPEELTANTCMYTTSQTAPSCSCMYVNMCIGARTMSHRFFYQLYAHIDQAGVVSLSQVVQHRGFVEAGEVGHVLHFAEARGIHPLHLLPGQRHPPLAVCQLNLHLITALFPNTGRLEVEVERGLTKTVWQLKEETVSIQCGNQ